MANLITLYWRDIPAQVIAERGRGRKREQAKIELPRRFSVAIDAAAMRDRVDSTDDYLSEWRRSEPEECGEDLKAEVAERAAALGDEYTPETLRALVENGGKLTASRKD
ncbi:virulence factor [Candidatus Puniceispirillum sp.]|nr:virulence factor [Candidatus Puniceispirillum sp.]